MSHPCRLRATAAAQLAVASLAAGSGGVNLGGAFFNQTFGNNAAALNHVAIHAANSTTNPQNQINFMYSEGSDDEVDSEG